MQGALARPAVIWRHKRGGLTGGDPGPALGLHMHLIGTASQMREPLLVRWTPSAQPTNGVEHSEPMDGGESSQD